MQKKMRKLYLHMFSGVNMGWAALKEEGTTAGKNNSNNPITQLNESLGMDAPISA
jgi:hypothetical protein